MRAIIPTRREGVSDAQTEAIKASWELESRGLDGSAPDGAPPPEGIPGFAGE